MAPAFPPYVDSKRFPVLCDTIAASSPNLDIALMSCDSLVAYAPEDVGRADMIGRRPGREWHEYGDVRWPSEACWIEFQVTNLPQFQLAGALLIRQQIPLSFPDSLDWAGYNHPKALFDENLRTEEGIERFTSALHQAANSTDIIPGPADEEPCHIQTYLLFGKSLRSHEHKEIASYTDLLNREGVPIARYRTAQVRTQNIPWCRCALSALFHLNRERLKGHPFVAHRQNHEFTYKALDKDQVPAKWTNFHPCRVLRNRPSIRSIAHTELVEGLIDKETFEAITDARRREANRELVAFERECRPRDMALQNLDSNTTIGAFVHRANGAAIYLLPFELVEEFDKTDCSEVQLSDLSFPFFSFYLRFDPLNPLELGDGAVVDGCYVVKQQNEVLLSLTSKRQGVDYENSFALTCLDPMFALHLPCDDPQMSITKAVELGIQAFRESNAPPSESMSQVVEKPNGLTTRIVDVRAASRKRRIAQFENQEPAFRACLNIVINAACFISFRTDDIEEAWEGTPPGEVLAAASSPGDTRAARDRRTAALRRIDNGDFTRVKICGRKLFAADFSTERDTGRSVRAHWRRGHWRRQRLGSGLVQIQLRWIRPTLVKKDAGAPVEGRLYEP